MGFRGRSVPSVGIDPGTPGRYGATITYDLALSKNEAMAAHYRAALPRSHTPSSAISSL